MTNSPNPHYISQNANGSSMTQPVDTVDFPHSGLIKALNQMAAGNVVVKTGTDFDINQTGGNLVVAAGKILRNGKYHEVATKTFADNSLTTTYDKGYHLLVVADGREGGETVDVLYLRPPTAANRVPEFKLGDTIVAMIEYSSSTSAGSRLIQFFTTNKESNSLSIAYANSNVYTQAMTVDADSDGDVTFENIVSDKDIIFKVNDGGVSREILRLDADDNEVRIVSTIDGADMGPQLTLFRDTADADDNDLIGLISFKGEDSTNAETEYIRMVGQILDESNGTEDAQFFIRMLVGGTLAYPLKLTPTQTIFNAANEDIDVRIDGATDNLFYADSSADKIGIGHNSPDATLDLLTGGTFRNTRLLTVSVSASTTLTEAAHAGRYNICAGNITLPSTSTAGEHYAILNTTGGNITIGRNGNNINGAGSDFTLGTFKAATCIAIGSNNWMVVG